MRYQPFVYEAQSSHHRSIAQAPILGHAMLAFKLVFVHLFFTLTFFTPSNFIHHPFIFLLFSKANVVWFQRRHFLSFLNWVPHVVMLHTQEFLNLDDDI
jgi:hypothetical protein